MGFKLRTQFDLVKMGFRSWGFQSKMALFSGGCSVSVSALLLALFRFFCKFFISFDKDESFQMTNSGGSIQNLIEPEVVSMKSDSEVSKSDGDSEFSDADDGETPAPEPEPEPEPEPSFVFKFEFQTKGILSRSNELLPQKLEEPEVMVNAEVSNFIVEERNSGGGSAIKELEFMEEAKVSNFTMKEVNTIKELEVLPEKLGQFEKTPQVTSSKYDFKAGESVSCFVEEAKVANFTVREANACEEIAHNSADGEKVDSGEVQFISEDDFVGSDSDSDSIGSSLVFSMKSPSIGSSLSYGFLSEADFVEDDETVENFEHIDLQNLDTGYEPDCFDDEEEDQNLQGINSKDENPKEDLENNGKSYGKNLTANESEDSSTLETLWEHQELIEQLKMELKKVRATGLPTILEESESPNMDDLKPWKIDEKSHHSDRMGELHKFYRSYRERMRKFDILNYQKLYAIGFLQSKDPLQSFSSGKSLAPAIKSFLSQNFWGCKPKKTSDSDPMAEFIRELHSDLEVVYVGQLCLSWELLQWQYEKAFELWESDPYGISSYNEVAGEFQQFQVLMQRFVENERFQGPRVENYVKNRCVTRNLLQVPMIRSDRVKEKKKARKKGKDDGTITSDILLEILEESIRIIWRFIRADKYANSTIVGQKKRQVELLELDSTLLMEVQIDLHKKERKLKELSRSGNCLLKRFKKHEDEGVDHLYFFSQVDMKLVSRVLNMSNITTEQLVWCHNKLSKIQFVNRKIRVDPSLLLFPC